MTTTETRPDVKGRRKQAIAEGRIPRHCPRWCKTDHLAVLDENQIDVHFEHFRSGGEGILTELRNPIDGRLLRGKVQGYDMHVSQTEEPSGVRGEQLLWLYTSWSEYDGPDREALSRGECTVKLTAGEARTMAAQLLALVDAVDLRP